MNHTAVKGIKLLSLSSLSATSLGAPLLLLSDTSSAVAQWVAVGGIAAFGAFTTSLLHWLASPYVHRIVARDGRVIAEQRSLLGRAKPLDLVSALLMCCWPSLCLLTRVFRPTAS